MGIMDRYRELGNSESHDNDFGAPSYGKPRKETKLWLNPGYRAKGEAERFVSVPLGLGVDTMEFIEPKGSNQDWLNFVEARNQLLANLQAIGDAMEPGQEVPIYLELRLHKAAEKKKPSEQADNPYLRGQSALTASPEGKVDLSSHPLTQKPEGWVDISNHPLTNPPKGRSKAK